MPAPFRQGGLEAAPLPLPPGEVASGVSRKPDDGEGLLDVVQGGDTLSVTALA